LRHNRLHIQIATVFFGIMLFFAVLSNAVTSTVSAQVSSPATTVQATSPSTPSASQKSPTVRITSLTKGQEVPVGKDLTISGTSIDNTNSNDCKVSVRVNKINPYQQATATGAGGAATKDYSKWNFVLKSKYTPIKPGQNRITAKYECANNPALTAFSSVNVNGVPATTAATGTATSTTTNAAAKQPLQQQQPLTASNNNNPTSTSTSAAPQKVSPVGKGPLSSSTSGIAPQVKTGPSQTNAVNEEEQQPRRLATGSATTTTTPTQSSSTPRQPPISETANSNPAAPSTLSLAPNTKELSVSTNLTKDYISRGDTQSVTITVSNSTSNKKIVGADVNANIHNANGLIKTGYTGTTDSSGQASFSLKITPKAKPGLYAIEVNATASDYDPKSNTRVFEVNQ
jgi:hypothetical protein